MVGISRNLNLSLPLEGIKGIKGKHNFDGMILGSFTKPFISHRHTVKTIPRNSKNGSWFLASPILFVLTFKEPSTGPWIPRDSFYRTDRKLK